MSDSEYINYLEKLLKQWVGCAICANYNRDTLVCSKGGKCGGEEWRVVQY